MRVTGMTCGTATPLRIATAPPRTIPAAALLQPLLPAAHRRQNRLAALSPHSGHHQGSQKPARAFHGYPSSLRSPGEDLHDLSSVLARPARTGRRRPQGAERARPGSTQPLTRAATQSRPSRPRQPATRNPGHRKPRPRHRHAQPRSNAHYARDLNGTQWGAVVLPLYLSIQRLNYLRMTRHSSARIAVNLIT